MSSSSSRRCLPSDSIIGATPVALVNAPSNIDGRRPPLQRKKLFPLNRVRGAKLRKVPVKKKAPAPKREGFSLSYSYRLIAVQFVNFDQRNAGPVIDAVHDGRVIARLEPDQDGRFLRIRRRDRGRGNLVRICSGTPVVVLPEQRRVLEQSQLRISQRRPYSSRSQRRSQRADEDEFRSTANDEPANQLAL